MDTRYERQIGLIGEEGQRILKHSTAMIIGAGGIGNIAAKFLASSGVGNIVIVDNDKIEKSNLNRQILFNEESIGNYKAESLAKTLKKINPECKTDILVGRIQDFKTEVIESALNDFTDNLVILDCTDNIRSGWFIEKMGLDLKIPVVFAKTSKYFGVVTVIKDKPYLQKNYPTKQLNKDNSVFPVIGGIVGSYQANLALKLLLGLKVTDKVIHFDCLNDSIIQYEKANTI